MKKKTIVKWLLMIAMAVSLGCTAVATDSADVIIEAAEPVIVADQIYVDVWITFLNLSLYNDEVYFSYHLVDANGEMQRFENTRYPVSLDDGKCFITASLSLEEVKSLGEPLLRFDLVDMKSEYWFSYSESVVLNTAEVSLVTTLEQEHTAATQDAAEQNIMDMDHREKIQIFPLMYSLAGWGVVVWLLRLKRSRCM